MSVQAQSWVIKYSQHKGSELLLMLMIANHAHADGTNAFPSLKLLAEECRMSRRQIARLVKTLEASGELVVHRRGTRTNSYSIRMEDDPPRAPAATPDATSDKMSPPASDIIVSPPSDITVSPPLEPSLTVKEPSPNKPAVRSNTKGDIASNFGPPQNLGRKIGDYHFPDFRKLLDGAAPHLAGEHLPDVRKMWMSGATPLDVIKCYNVMRMESWRTHAVTWKTVASYLPDWKFKQDKGIVPGQEKTNHGKPKKIRTIADITASRDAWLRKHGVEPDHGSEGSDRPDQQDAIIAGLLNA